MRLAKPIRVMQVMGHMAGGGVEATIMNHYRHIDRSRVQFDFVVDADSTVVPADEIVNLGGHIFTVPPYKHMARYLKECERLFADKKPDIVHSNINALSVFPLLAAKRAGIKIRIAHSHSMANPKEHAKTAVKNILRPFSKLNPTHLVGCSTDSARWLFGENAIREGEVHIIKNAIDLERFRYRRSVRSSARTSLGIDEDTVVVGQIGRFCFQKNQLFTLEIFAELLKSNPNSLLLLVGDGEQRRQVEMRVQELGIEQHVRILGRRTDVDVLYQVFDVLAFPSTYEGLPLTGIEAQAEGLPIVLSTEISDEVSIMPELLYPMSLTESPKAWAKAILSSSARNTNREKLDISPLIDAGYEIQRSADSLTSWYMHIATR